ncbi:MAG: hypothetical protein CM15mP83_5540 [Flavobacteriaceae bacterium]|nr:MAG: hypothetical protein CM15mP83_5540 [Flavobacteriaceae bacterium]
MLWHLIKKWKENTWNFGNRLLVIHTGGHQSIRESTNDWQRKAVRCAGHAHLLASCGSKKQVYYADTSMNEQTITSQEKSKKRQKEKDKDVVYSSDPTTRYIQQYASIAQEEMRLYKIPASITLAQGLLESQLGQGTLAKKSNNHFGIKCKREWRGKSVS